MLLLSWMKRLNLKLDLPGEPSHRAFTLIEVDTTTRGRLFRPSLKSWFGIHLNYCLMITGSSHSSIQVWQSLRRNFQNFNANFSNKEKTYISSDVPLWSNIPLSNPLPQFFSLLFFPFFYFLVLFQATQTGSKQRNEVAKESEAL